MTCKCLTCGRDVSGKAPRNLDGFSVNVTDSQNCGRACVKPSEPTKVYVRSDYWPKWSAAGKTMAVAHEAAHSILDTDCEGCADMLAGAIGRNVGLSRTGAVQGLNEVVGDARPLAPRSAGKGYDNA